MRPAEVLVVEDEALICDLLTSALEDEGAVVTCAASPEEAFTALADHAATLRVLITDVNLNSVLSGFDVARVARKRLPTIFVLYTTGHAEADLASEGVPGGMMVPKPYYPTLLAERVRSVLRFVGTF